MFSRAPRLCFLNQIDSDLTVFVGTDLTAPETHIPNGQKVCDIDEDGEGKAEIAFYTPGHVSGVVTALNNDSYTALFLRHSGKLERRFNDELALNTNYVDALTSGGETTGEFITYGRLADTSYKEFEVTFFD